MSGLDTEVLILTNKISELEKNYIDMEKKYLKKIKKLKEELVHKHQVQYPLSQELSTSPEPMISISLRYKRF